MWLRSVCAHDLGHRESNSMIKSHCSGMWDWMCHLIWEQHPVGKRLYLQAAAVSHPSVFHPYPLSVISRSLYRPNLGHLWIIYHYLHIPKPNKNVHSGLIL